MTTTGATVVTRRRRARGEGETKEIIARGENGSTSGADDDEEHE